MTARSYIPGVSAATLRRHPWLQPKFGFGLALGPWLRLLARHGFRVHWTRWPCLPAITAAAAIHSALHGLQRRRHGKAIAAAHLDPAPVFIVGHWRSGTTLLHELLALDPGHTCPNSLECFCPGHFLLTGNWLPRLTPMPRNAVRVLDNTPMQWDSPQEDEFALMYLGLPSPYLMAAFPNETAPYDPWFTLDDVRPAERRQWIDTYRGFLQSVALRRPGRLILKSPLHTFRIPLLHEIFPGARFILLVRNPCEVFASSLHAVELVCRLNGLQVPHPGVLEEYVLARYERLQRSLDAARPNLGTSRLLTVRFEDLVRDPERALERVYADIAPGGWPAVRTRVREFVARRAGYQPNRLAITPAQRQRVADRWGPWIRAYGYAEA